MLSEALLATYQNFNIILMIAPISLKVGYKALDIIIRCRKPHWLITMMTEAGATGGRQRLAWQGKTNRPPRPPPSATPEAHNRVNTIPIPFYDWPIQLFSAQRSLLIYLCLFVGSWLLMGPQRFTQCTSRWRDLMRNFRPFAGEFSPILTLGFWMFRQFRFR